jgi:hypothetical protein
MDVGNVNCARWKYGPLELEDGGHHTDIGECDERRPLCAKCQLHFDGLDQCDFPPQHLGAPKSQKNSPSSVGTPPIRTKKRDSLRESKDPQLPIFLGAGIDPFMVHPDSNVPDAQLLMHHCTLIHTLFTLILWLGSDFSNFNAKTFPIVLSHETKPLIAVWLYLSNVLKLLTHSALVGLGRAWCRSLSCNDTPQCHPPCRPKRGGQWYPLKIPSQ